MQKKDIMQKVGVDCHASGCAKVKEMGKRA